MAHLTLTSEENVFLREALLFVERHTIRQIELDRSLLHSPFSDQSLYETMLVEDTVRLDMAKSLYNKLIEAL